MKPKNVRVHYIKKWKALFLKLLVIHTHKGSIWKMHFLLIVIAKHTKETFMPEKPTTLPRKYFFPKCMWLNLFAIKTFSSSSSTNVGKYSFIHAVFQHPLCHRRMGLGPRTLLYQETVLTACAGFITSCESVFPCSESLCVPLFYLSICIDGPQVCLLLSVFQTPQGRGKAVSGVCTATLPALAGCRADPLAMGDLHVARGWITLALSPLLL